MFNHNSQGILNLALVWVGEGIFHEEIAIWTILGLIQLDENLRIKFISGGHLTRSHLASLFRKAFSEDNGDVFANHIFRIFDKDGNGFLDFKEFLMAINVTTCNTLTEKMTWAFRCKHCNMLTLFKGAIVLFLYIFISLFIIFCFKKAFKNHLFLLLKFMQLLKNFAPSRGGRGRPWSHMQGGGLSCTVLCRPMRWLDSLKVNLVLHS